MELQDNIITDEERKQIISEVNQFTTHWGEKLPSNAVVFLKDGRLIMIKQLLNGAKNAVT